MRGIEIAVDGGGGSAKRGQKEKGNL